MIKKVEARYKELAAMGIAVRIICVGRKGSAYFKRRPQYTVEGACALGWGSSRRKRRSSMVARRLAAALGGTPLAVAGVGRRGASGAAAPAATVQRPRAASARRARCTR